MGGWAYQVIGSGLVLCEIDGLEGVAVLGGVSGWVGGWVGGMGSNESLPTAKVRWVGGWVDR